MSKHIIFLTHGMGNHVHGQWEIPIINMLNDLFKSYNVYTYESKSLDECVEFVPITYDNIFREQVSKWENKFDVLLTSLNENNHFNTTPISDWLKIASPKEQDFFWTHIVDVLLYRFFPNITQMIRIHVINQIKDRLKNETDVPNCSVIAHSLGTAVMHDSLHLLFTTAWGGLPNLLLQQFKFQSITMLANTSRVLTNDVPDTGEFYNKIYNSVVKPKVAFLSILIVGIYTTQFLLGFIDLIRLGMIMNNIII